MAISRKTQKDVGKYQAKLVGPLTLRQTVYIGIGTVIAVLVYNIMTAFGASQTDKIAAAIIVVAPFAILGTASPYGMTCLEFVKNYYEYHILSSKTRHVEIEAFGEEQSVKDDSKKNKKKDEKDPHRKKYKEFPSYM